jgi:hypothetical protein
MKAYQTLTDKGFQRETIRQMNAFGLIGINYRRRNPSPPHVRRDATNDRPIERPDDRPSARAWVGIDYAQRPADYIHCLGDRARITKGRPAV